MQDENETGKKEGVERDLAKRTKNFALRIIKLYVSLPKSTEAQVIGKQVLRSGTSVGAHYREGKRARSNAEFVSKLGGALQEIDETIYWLELLIESGLIPKKRLAKLHEECTQLCAIFITSINTAKKKS